MIQFKSLNRLLSLYFCIIVAFYSCNKEASEQIFAEGRQILVYMIADNNLDYFAVNDINEMEQGLAQSGNATGEILVFIDRGDNGDPSHPYLMRVLPDTTDKIQSEILKVYPELNSADAQTLQKVLADIDEITEAPYQAKGLVLWSHGNAWLPPEVSLYSDRDKIIDTVSVRKIKSFGYDEDTQSALPSKEMDVIELSDVLSPYHFDFILFDACFMGCIEVAYEVKDVCKYVISSPTEILSAGFPYHRIMEDMLKIPVNPIEIAEKKHEYYLSQKGILSSSSISVVKTNELRQLASFIRTFLVSKISDIDIGNTNSVYTKDSLQQFDRLEAEYLFDFYDFIEKACTQNNSIDLFNKFEERWNRAVIYNEHTSSILGTLDIQNCNGLSMYIPQAYETRTEIEKYYKTLSWYEESNGKMLFMHY